MKKLLSTEEAAPFAGVEAKTLANWRSLGFGPRFLKIGGRVRYDPDDLVAYREARRVASTSQPIAA